MPSLSQSLIVIYLLGVIYMVRRQIRHVWAEDEETAGMQSSQNLYFHSDLYPGKFKNFDWTQIDAGNMMFRSLGIASAKRITVTHRIR